jgi:hypothetical protein
LQKIKHMSRAVTMPKNRFFSSIRDRRAATPPGLPSERQNFEARTRITIKRNVNRKTPCLLLTL